MLILSFKPKQVSKKLLLVLPERAKDVVSKRFGLNNSEGMTLEAIGNEYGITRERVRQIENFALGAIRKSGIYENEQPAFKELEDIVISLGGVVSEDELFPHIAKDRETRNHINFFLVLGEPFVKHREDEHFKHRWAVDGEIADQVHDSLKKLYASLTDDELISENEIVKRFLENLKNVSERYRNEEITKRWLLMSKKIGKNPLGEWGIADSPNVRARGMRDYAFLVIRRKGNPMHFTEVAKEIEKLFGKKAHTATCHNELIKDPRFVLVGRGLYALSNWGYAGGIVRDVVRDVLRKNGALTKQEIISKVLKERYVKTNTILVNLQNPKYFKKDKLGRYQLV